MLATMPPSRTALSIAAVGSAVLALPGAVGFAGVVFLLEEAGSEPAILAFALAVFGAVVVGVGLLVGYWRAWRSTLSAGQARAVWWVSAALDGLLATAVLGTATFLARPNSGPGGALPLAFLPIAAWPVRMTWLGVTRARAVAGGGVGDDEPSPAGRAAQPGLIVAAVGSAGVTMWSLFGLARLVGALEPTALATLDVVPWIGFMLAGAALAVGYAWAWLAGLPRGVERPFWWTSAAVNGTSVLVAFATLMFSCRDLWEAGGPVSLLGSVAGAAWSGWLAWFSVARAEPAAGETGGRA